MPQIEISKDSKIVFYEYPLLNYLENEFKNYYVFDKLFNRKDSDDHQIKPKINVIFVITESEIECKNGISLQVFEKAEKMFPNTKELIENVAVVITKCYTDLNESDYVEMIDDSASELDCKWANILKSRLNQVFVLPKPLRKDVGKNFEYECCNRLKHFLKVNLITNPIIKFEFTENIIQYLNLRKLRGITLKFYFQNLF